MRRFRNTLLVALALMLCAAPAAGARNQGKDHDGLVTASKGRLVAEAWAQIYSLPTSENPLAGNGNPCLTVGHKVLEAVGGGPCTITQGTALLLYLGSVWSNAEAPFPADEAAQRAVALAADQSVSEIQVTVDDGDPVDIQRARFELFSPQRTVQLPAENILGVPAQTVTLTAHGWSALVRNLRPGPHNIIVTALWDGVRITAPHVINVVRHKHLDEGSGHQD
jgi:hypothetical protein